MNLTIDEAAARMGKTARQVRYLIAQGKLPAHKDGKSWRLRSQDLPLPDGAKRSRQHQEGRIRAAVEDLVANTGTGGSLADVKAFVVGRPLLSAVQEHLGQGHPASLTLRGCLLQVGRGYHRYHGPDKAQAYTLARDLASEAAVALLLDPPAEAPALAAQVETELMPALTGLIRRLDRQTRARDWKP